MNSKSIERRNVFCLCPRRQRTDIDAELTAAMLRHPGLSVNPQKLWRAKINLTPYTTSPTFGFDALNLPDGALMVRLSSLKAGAGAASYVNPVFFSFYDFDNPMNGGVDVLDGSAPIMFTNQVSQTGYTTRDATNGWYYCKGKKEIILCNGHTVSRNLGIEVFTSN